MREEGERLRRECACMPAMLGSCGLQECLQILYEVYLGRAGSHGTPGSQTLGTPWPLPSPHPGDPGRGPTWWAGLVRAAMAMHGIAWPGRSGHLEAGQPPVPGPYENSRVGSPRLAALVDMVDLLWTHVMSPRTLKTVQAEIEQRDYYKLKEPRSSPMSSLAFPGQPQPGHAWSGQPSPAGPAPAGPTRPAVPARASRKASEAPASLLRPPGPRGGG